MYGPAFKIDKNIAEKYGKKKWLKNKPKTLTKKKCNINILNIYNYSIKINI